MKSTLEREPFIEGLIEEVTRVLEAGEVYEWLYEKDTKGCQSVCIKNMADCSSFYLSCHDFTKRANDVAVNPTQESAQALREWFVVEMAISVAKTEWLAYAA